MGDSAFGRYPTAQHPRLTRNKISAIQQPSCLLTISCPPVHVVRSFSLRTFENLPSSHHGHLHLRALAPPPRPPRPRPRRLHRRLLLRRYYPKQLVGAVQLRARLALTRPPPQPRGRQPIQPRDSRLPGVRLPDQQHAQLPRLRALMWRRVWHRSLLCG